MSTPRWFTDNDPDHSRRYVDRFRRLAADGADLDGEARLIDGSWNGWRQRDPDS